MKKIYLLLFLSCFCLLTHAQTTVFTETFGRASINAAGTPTTYTYADAGSTGTVGVNTGASGALSFTSTSAGQGRMYESGLTSSYITPYNSVLSSNTISITWSFNMRTNIAVSNTVSLAGNNYCMAVVLGASAAAFLGNGNGYAVKMNTNGSVSLINFTSGINNASNTTLATSTIPAGSGTNFISVKVTFEPSTSTWSLALRDDGASAFTDPTTGGAYGTPATVVNSTYTGISLTNFGFYYCYQAVASKVGLFDNYRVIVNTTNCAGTPTPGTATETITSPVCSSINSTMSLTGGSSGLTGLTYQWQSSPNNSTWTNVSGATNSTYAATGSTAIYYRSVMGCSFGGSSVNSSSAYVEPLNCVTMSNGSSSICSGVFYDPGGSGSGYSNNQHFTYTFYPGSPGNLVKVTFSSFNTEASFDFLDVYNGNSTSASLLASNSGNISIGPYTSSASDGSLTFDFTSDGSNTRAGWVANVTCVPGPPQIISSPTSLAFGTVTVGDSSSTQNLTINGYNLTSSGSITITAPTGFKVNNGTSWVSSFNYSYSGTSISSYVIPVRFYPLSAISYSANITLSGGGVSPSATVTVTGTGAPLCSGTPTAGVTISSGGGTCGSFTTTLSLTGVSAVGGLTYQWQSSPDNSSWSNIAGATSFTYAASGSSSTYFRCRVTCSASSLSANSYPAYCEVPTCINISNGSTATCNAQFFDPGGAAGNYAINQDFTYTFYPSTPGNKVKYTFTSFSTESGYDFLDIYNGNSVSATLVGSYDGTTSPGTFTSTAADGSLTFHFTSDVTIVSSGFAANITCVTPPACSGTPTPGATVASVSTGCAPSFSSTMSMGTAIITSGISCQWYVDNGAGYNAIPGATSATYIASVTNLSESYKCTQTCNVSGFSATSTPVTVTTTPAIVVAGSPTTICQGTSVTLTNANPGGTWSTSSSTIVTINSSGVATGGTAAGTATLSYTRGSCVQTYSLTNILNAPAITGTTTLCNGFSTTLANTSSGGVWSTNDAAIADVEAVSGVVTAMSVGTTTITYTSTCNYVTTGFTVNTQPDAITGGTGVCISSTITLSDATPGGTWSISGTATGTTISAGGVVTSSSTVGTETVSYTLGSCAATSLLSVGNGSPAAITGSTTVCLGFTTSLADATPGGAWISSDPTIASVSSSGVVTGISVGTVTITYNSGCGAPPYSLAAMTVNGTSVSLTYGSGGLSGPICSGGTLTLSSGTTAGGTYSWTGPNSFTSASQNPTISSVTTAASGIYNFSATVSGCNTGVKQLFVAVDALPTSVSASATAATICAGGVTTLSSVALPAFASSAYVVNAINYQLFDTTGTATTTGDDVTDAVALPFSFDFFNATFSSVIIGANGYINFNTAGTNPTAIALPSTSAPRALIALFWHNLYNSGSRIKYKTVGTAPDRKFIVSFNNVPDRNSATGLASTTAFNNGQIVLYETTNVIELYITKTNTGGAYNSVCGIQNNGRSVAFTIPAQNNANYTIDHPAGTGWRISPTSFNYSWSPAVSLSASNIDNPVSTGLTSTTIFTVTAVDANSGCTTGLSNTTTVTVNPLPVISTTPLVVCAGVTTTASGANTYSWSPSAGLSASTGAVVTPSGSIATTNYTITGTSAAGCVNTYSLTAHAAPVLSVTPTSAICVGGNTGISASGASTYSWTNAASLSASTGASVTASPVSTTTYSVSGADAFGCPSLVSPGVTVTVSAIPVAGALTAASGYCLGSGSPYSISTGVATGPGTVSSYNWSGPAAFSTTTASPSVSFTPASTAASGVYSLTVTYPGSGCVSAPVTTGTVTVADYPTTYNLTGGSGCSATGVTVGLDGSQTSDYIYNLKRGSTVVATLSGNTTTLSYATVTAAGTYSVVAVGPGGCQTDMVGTSVVGTTPAASVSAAMPNICQPTTSASIGLSSIVGAPTTYSVTWNATALSDGGFSNITSDPLTGSSVTLIYNPSGGAGSFDGTLTLSNGACTSAPYPVHTIVHGQPLMSISAINTPCSGYAGSIEFTGTDSASVAYSIDGGATSNFIFSGTTYSLSTGPITTAHNYLIIDAHNAVCTTFYSTPITITPTQMEWVGGTVDHETEWNRATNWSCGFVPTVVDDVQISSAAFDPVVPSAFAATTRDLTINSGGVLVIDGTGEVDVKGTFSNNNYVSGIGRVVLNGSAAQTITGIGTTNNLELDNSNGATINTGSRMIIGSTLTITAGTLITNDSLELASTDTNSTARIAAIPSTGAAISGKVKVDQYVMGGYRRYRFFAHPFSDTMSLSQLQTYIDITGPGGSANGFRSTASNAPSAFRLDPYTENWTLGYDPGWKPFTKINATAADSNRVHPGQGIRLFFRGAKGEGLGYLGYAGLYFPSATTYKMSGNINQGDVSITLSQGAATTLQDFNMVGNPYPSPVDMGTALWYARAAGQISGSGFYLFDAALGAGGQFIIVNLDVSPTPFYVQANTCVQVRAAYDGAHIDFTEADKVPYPSLHLYKSPVEHTVLKVYDEQNHLWDILQLNFNDLANDREDRLMDAVKPMGVSDFNFYSVSADNSKLAVDSRPFAAEKVIPLGIASGYQQNFIVRAENIVVPAGGSLVLHDKLLEKYVDLKAGTEYPFTISKEKSTQGDRFELALKSNVPVPAKPLAITMTPNPTTDDVKISFTSGKKEKVTVRVMDITGVSVYSKDLGEQQNGTISVPLGMFAAGIYMVELTQGDQKLTQRLVKE